MKTLVRRTTLMAGALATCAGVILATSPGACAATVWTLNYNATATTTIAKMGKSVTTTGTSTTDVTLETRTLTSSLTLAPVTTSAVDLGSLPLAYATVAVEPTAKATGTIDDNQVIHITQYAYLHITKLTGPAKLVNLVGANCRTATPVRMDLSGKMQGLFDPTKLSGTFTIPRFSGCGAFGILNSVVSSKMSGPGNTVALTLTPR